MSINIVNDEDDFPSAGMIQYYISLISEGKPDPDGSEQLLKIFCAKAKNLSMPGASLPEPILALIISAFEKYLSGEEKSINKSLGLIKRGKPKNPSNERRNCLIAADVLRLVEAGKNKTISRYSDGAFYTIAQKYKLGESEVEKIFYEYENKGIAILAFEKNDSVPS
jgi:hypothetical protein